jgi:predicted metal-dependent phosphotriesterase family hydrolase
MTSGIHTVLGVIPPGKIRLTDCHAHLFIRGGMPVLHYPDFKLADYEQTAVETREFLQAGGSAVVEMSPIDWGRDIKSMVRLSQETGVHIVAATGFHKLFYYSDIHWLYQYSQSQLADLVYDELSVGMDINAYNGPIIQRIDSTAGVIKVGTGSCPFSAAEEKLLHVVAEVHQRTNAPIITHTDEGALALEQLKYLERLGVSSRRVAISHLDRRPDIDLHKEIAAGGAFLEYDAMTRCNKGLDEITLKLILALVNAGYAKSIIVGSDLSRQGYWRSYGGSPGLKFLPGEFHHRLTRAGLSEAELRCIYIENPRELLTW